MTAEEPAKLDDAASSSVDDFCHDDCPFYETCLPNPYASIHCVQLIFDFFCGGFWTRERT